jgi:hypothetical protein
MGIVKLAKVENSAPPPEDPLRAALAAAIAEAAEARAALKENAAAQARVEETKWPTLAALDKATEQLDRARLADAEAVARGGAGGALKAARTQLQDATDAEQVARAAEVMLKE